MQFDYDTDDYRVFPVFWGEDYFVTFPLVWWFDEVKGVFPVFWWKDGFTAFPLAWYEKDEFNTLFPLWVYIDDGDDAYDFHALWPIVRRKKTDGEDGFDVWPLVGSYDTDDGHRRYALWPLIQDRLDGDERVRVAAPLWFEYEDDKTASWCLFPAAYRAKDADGDTTLITPLWSAGSHQGKDWSMLFPLYYASSSEKDDEQTVITLLGGRHRRGDETTLYALPLLSSYAWGEGEKEFWLLGPLAHAKWDANHSQHHVLPFYYYDSAEKMLLTPLVSCKRKPKDSFTNVGIVLGHYGQQGGRQYWSVLWPIFQRKWGETWSEFDIFPLASWKRSNSDSVVERGKDNTKYNVHYDRRAFWLFPWIYSSQSNRSETPEGKDAPTQVNENRGNGAFPLWSYKHRVTQGAIAAMHTMKLKAPPPGDGKHTRTDFSLLGWLYDYRRRLTEPKDGKANDYVRSRILWRVMHYERIDGDSAVEVFPAIHWSKGAAGDGQFSFFWRLFRLGHAAGGGTNLDVLFIPILRAGEKNEAAEL